MTQTGNDNDAAVTQSGEDNDATVSQTGDGNDASITQSAFGLPAAAGAAATVTQTSDDNLATVTQSADATATVTQGGSIANPGPFGGRDNNVVDTVTISNSQIVDSDNGVRIKTVSGATGQVKVSAF